MASDKVDLVLSNPWRDDKDKVHEVGERVSVPADLAERLITGGTATAAKPASK